MEMDRILFVDDEPLVLDALKRMLKRHADHWDMAFMSDPQAACARFASAPFDVVVSDLQMPKMSGLELAKAVREKAPSTQVIMLTGTADLAKAIDAINEAGVFRFYTKPCPADLLAEGVKAALLERRRRVNADAFGAAGRAGIGEAALSRLPIGVVVVDGAARLAFMNPRGAAMVTARDGLVLGHEQVLRAADPDDTAELHRVIKALANGDASGAAQGLAIERPSMARPLSLRAEAMAAENGERDEPLVILFVTDPETPPAVSPAVVARIFGLTDQESRVAAAIAQGATPEEAATDMNLTVGTVRTYLKQIFSKTGTSRQAELVNLILTSPTAV